jgi:hypothetical protein
MPDFIYQHILDNFNKFIKISIYILLLIGWIGVFLKVPFPFSSICFISSLLINVYLTINIKRQYKWTIKMKMLSYKNKFDYE